MKSELISDINQAFLHLEFTIKLLTYMKRRIIDKDEFDTAIVIDTSLQSVGKKHDLKNQSSEGMLRNLIYMIRCAYAHDMMHPKWKVGSNYPQLLEIQLQSDILRLDLSTKHKKSFNIEDIGGYENYFEIKDLICKMIS